MALSTVRLWLFAVFRVQGAWHSPLSGFDCLLFNVQWQIVQSYAGREQYHRTDLREVWHSQGNDIKLILGQDGELDSVFCSSYKATTLFWRLQKNSLACKKRLTIPKGLSESVNRRRTIKTMNNRIRTKWKTTIYKTYSKTKDRLTRTPLRTGSELRCSGKVSSSYTTSCTFRGNIVTKPVRTETLSTPRPQLFTVKLSMERTSPIHGCIISNET